MRPAPVRAKLNAQGIRRLGSKRAFRYRHADGRPVGRKQVEHIRSLAIPPAWRDVAIAPSPSARVQAIGRDAAGRWQYLYHRAHTEYRSRRKFDRPAAFGQARCPRCVAGSIVTFAATVCRSRKRKRAVLLLAACAIRLAPRRRPR
jgi:DNA topoisomerase IB